MSGSGPYIISRNFTLQDDIWYFSTRFITALPEKRVPAVILAYDTHETDAAAHYFCISVFAFLGTACWLTKCALFSQTRYWMRQWAHCNIYLSIYLYRAILIYLKLSIYLSISVRFSRYLLFLCVFVFVL